MPAGGGNRGAGRKPFVPTPRQRRDVQLLTAAGMPQHSICKHILDANRKPISVRTLYTKFKEEIAYGLECTVAEVAKSLFQKALGNDAKAVQAAIFLLRTRGGYRETQSIEHSGPNQGPILMGTIDPNDAQEAYLKLIQGR